MQLRSCLENYFNRGIIVHILKLDSNCSQYNNSDWDSCKKRTWDFAIQNSHRIPTVLYLTTYLWHFDLGDQQMDPKYFSVFSNFVFHSQLTAPVDGKPYQSWSDHGALLIPLWTFNDDCLSNKCFILYMFVASSFNIEVTKVLIQSVMSGDQISDDRKMKSSGGPRLKFAWNISVIKIKLFQPNE